MLILTMENNSFKSLYLYDFLFNYYFMSAILIY